mmetsp:Transcript_6399/g.16571  ORF Transcript_6399/g.16571 Transcript_6399/m.16571 type:complete len:239 (+) Transcript_6399:3154-3870(+)
MRTISSRVAPLRRGRDPTWVLLIHSLSPVLAGGVKAWDTALGVVGVFGLLGGRAGVTLAERAAIACRVGSFSMASGPGRPSRAASAATPRASIPRSSTDSLLLTPGEIRTPSSLQAAMTPSRASPMLLARLAAVAAISLQQWQSTLPGAGAMGAATWAGAGLAAGSYSLPDIRLAIECRLGLSKIESTPGRPRREESSAMPRESMPRSMMEAELSTSAGMSTPRSRQVAITVCRLCSI